jgi:hypothetical protein
MSNQGHGVYMTTQRHVHVFQIHLFHILTKLVQHCISMVNTSGISAIRTMLDGHAMIYLIWYQLQKHISQQVVQLYFIYDQDQ